MRKRILGAIAAVTAGAGAAWGQAPSAPPPPAPIGTVGGYQGGVMPATGYADPIPPPVGAGAAPAADPNAGMFGGGPVGYPPPGQYNQPSYQTPFADGLHSRLASRWWLSGEYLMWFSKAQPARYPFVTTSAPAAGGRIGEPSTLILHANGDLGYDLLSGFRITGGFFRDDCRRTGWYASGFMTENGTNDFSVASDATGQPLLARPFINAATGQQDVLFVSFPTFAGGRVSVQTHSRAWGAEGGPICNLYRSCPDDGCGPFWNVDLITGFRFFQLKEDLSIRSFTDVLPGQAVPFDGKLYFGPVNIEVNDEFTTLNQFYGGQVGLNAQTQWGKCYFSVLGKIALGVMHERVDVNGFSILRQTGALAPSVVRGGLYANSTNIGRYDNDEFCVLPEVNANIGYNWCSWLTTYVGYTFLYASRVVRPGDQYSPVVNPAVIPTSPSFGTGAAIPTPNRILTQSDYWIQGVSFGAMIRY
jgi:hypothetical protein